ncbi:uncharacterized protein LOC133335759 [Musca vetustissima]|uniref:uncharacterized protein LOC133335759 n=1 Tax=Musca vetustissima TaxID=27455 RepID=UPI002AB5F871|nr:uncharacterized protein LOC133335759 [Musca vetustissima]
MGPENIPLMNEINFMSMDTLNGQDTLTNMEITNLKSDDDSLKLHSISAWNQDNDDGTDGGGDDSGAILDDNISQVGSDYSEFPGNEIFGQSMPSDSYGEDIKYHPAEMMLRPTSSSAIQFNYNFPPLHTLTPQQQQQQHHHQNSSLHQPQQHPSQCSQPPIYGGDHHRHIPLPERHLYHRNSRDMCDSPTTDYNQNSHPSQNYFPSNMWYPNAPIGGYRSYGSHVYGRQYGGQFPHDHMMDMFQLSNSGREARNRAEKNRRDKLNGSIQELSTMVPHVAESPRRVDKTAVLRFSTHGLRLQYVFGKSLNNESVQTTDALMKLLQSFFLTITCSGQIVLVSTSIEEHLGHCQTDLYGQNILHITHPEDHQMLKQKLIPTDLDALFDIQPEDANGEPRQRTKAEEDEIDRRLREDRRSFTVRLARAGPRSEATTYELVKIEGSFRRSDMAPRGLKTSTFPSTLQLMRRRCGREDMMPFHTISGNDIVLIAIARIVRPPVINPLIEANRLEYKTRHLIDGRIIDCDQRISLVAGYMTGEVRNLSPFTFMHQDDVRWVIVALRQMYDCNSSYGESTYRLFTRNGKIIYLHTKGFLEIDKSTNKVHSFICVNTLLSEEEGKKRIEHMKNKFSVIIDAKIPQSFSEVPALENPLQLEKAVLCLIQNLQHPNTDADDVDSEMNAHTSQRANYHNNYQNSNSHHSMSANHMGRSSKTPPLALVPPGADSIKHSINKSVSVVKTIGCITQTNDSMAGQRGNSGGGGGVDDNGCGGSSTSGDSRRYSSNMDSDEYSPNGDHQTGLSYTNSGGSATKRKLNYSTSENEDDDDYGPPVQRRATENRLADPAQQIDNDFNVQHSAAMNNGITFGEDRTSGDMISDNQQEDFYLISDDLENEFQNQERFLNGNGDIAEGRSDDEINFNNSMAPNQTSPNPPETSYTSSSSSPQKVTERSAENN